MAAKRKTTTAIQTVRAYPVQGARAQPITLNIRTPKQQGGLMKKARRAGRAIRRAVGGLQYNEKSLLMVGAGGLAIGFLEDQFGDMLPDIPFVGRKGALTVGLYLLGKQGIGGQYVKDAALAGAAICGYQLGKEGEVSGM